MSHQPSTLDSLKDTASSTYSSVAQTVNPADKPPNYDPDKDNDNFTKDAPGNTMKKGDFKHQLNEAAVGGSNEKGNEQTMFEKVSSYIPGMNKQQKSADEQGGANAGVDPDAAPKRPEHDVQVEQFLRGQYHNTMDPFFSRDLPDFTPLRSSMPSSSSSSRPQSAGYSFRPPPQRDPRPRNPLTPPDLSGASIPSPPIDPVRKITPPEEHRIHTDEKLVVEEDPYKQAERYVEECRAWMKPGPGRYLPRPLEGYETPLRIKMSMGDWIKLDRKLNLEENDDPYPRLSYNAATSSLIIECMPSPLHQSITSILNEQFFESRATLPQDLKSQTYVSWETTSNKFGNEWAGSRKRPDFSIEVRDTSGRLKLKWVVEAGLSETYDQLVEDVRLWLEGHPDVAMVIIVKFCESPLYRCPVPTTQNPEELGIPLDILAIDEAEVTMEGQLGPAAYKGHKWVGKISEVFMETWVQDAGGRAVRQGNREDLLQAGQLQLSFGDILPPGYPQTITLDLDEFHNGLKEKIQQLATHRCREMVSEWVKRMGDRQSDRNYQPSQETASE